MEIEELDNVNGGYIFNPDEELIAPTWEVIDDKTGNVMWKTKKYETAVAFAKFFMQSTEILDWSTLNSLRKKSGSI